MSSSGPKEARDGDQRPDDQNAEYLSQGRRELIKRFGRAAMLPMIVASFMATDVTDAAAS